MRMKVSCQRVVELCDVDWLGKMIVHAGGTGMLDVLIEGICRHCDDRNGFRLRMRGPADFLRSFIAVMNRHLYVHENKVKGSLTGGGEFVYYNLSVGGG